LHQQRQICQWQRQACLWLHRLEPSMLLPMIYKLLVQAFYTLCPPQLLILSQVDTKRFWSSVQIKCLQSLITKTELLASFLAMVPEQFYLNPTKKGLDYKTNSSEVVEQAEIS